MAAPKEKLPSIGHLTNMKRKTFTKQRDHCLTNSKVRQLQQRWHELNERELRAQQHNKELLQQFEKAEKTLKEMLACTAAMKTIRIEYEQYLKESSPRWQQQLKEKTQAAQRMRMEDRSCLKNTKETEVTKAYADQRSQDKDAQNIHSDDKQHGSSYRPYVQTSWLTHPQSQTAEFPMRATHQPQSSSHFPPSFLPHPHPFVLHHFTPTPSHHLWPRQNAPGWSSLQADCPWSCTAGLPEALWGQLYNEEPPPELMVSQTEAQRPETSGASGSKSDTCGGRRTSCLSQELDVKPVRLSSGHAESSESGRDSGQVFREQRKKKEKRGRSQCTSSEKESHGSEESSRTSSAAVIASDEVVQGSETDVSSGKCSIKASKKSKRGNRTQVAKSLRTEKVPKENNRNKGDESANQHVSGESGRQTEESTSENTGNSCANDKSKECREESRSLNTQLKSKTGDEKQKQSISSEQSSSEEKDEDDEPEMDLGENNAEEKENSLENDYQDGDVEEEETDPEVKDKSLKEEQHKEDEEEAGEVSAEKKTTEEEETSAEDEMEQQECEAKDELKNDSCNKRSSASSQDEEDEREQDKTEDEEVSDEKEHRESEEEQMSDKEREPEEESDSEDGIISPKENRPKGRHIIPEEAAEDDNEKMGTQTGTTDADASKDFSENDDIENLLAPQEQRKKRQDKDLKAAEKPKVSDMKIFQVEGNRSTQVTPHSDSDEFDHFYD